MFLVNPFARFFFAPESENGAAVADAPEDLEADEEVGEPGDGADDGSAEGESDVSDEIVDDEPADEPEVEEPAVFNHGIEGLPTGQAELRQWYDQQRSQQAQLQQQNQALQAWYAQQQQIAAQQQLHAQQAAQQKQAPEKPKLPWTIPDFDRSAMRFLQRDPESGQIVPVSQHVDPSLVGKYHAWSDARDGAIDGFFRDPTVIGPALQPYIQEQATQIAQQQIAPVMQALQQLAQQQRLSQYEQQQQWVRDPQTGQPTAATQKFNAYYSEALQMNHPDPIRYADRMLNADLADVMLSERETQDQAAKQKAAQAKANAKKRDDLLASANKPNRSGAQSRRTRETHAPRAGTSEFLMNRLKKLPASDYQSKN